jgi:hypothetical protein
MSEPADRDHLQRLLDKHRFNIEVILLKKAQFGIAHLPLPVFHELNDACSAIRAIKKTLLEQGVEVSDAINDDAFREIFSQDIGLHVNPRSKFASTQFEAYFDIWRSLQALRIAGDALWERASHENIGQFAQQLRDTSSQIQIYQPFFEESHYHVLKELLNEFGRFRLGKVRLVEFISSRDEGRVIHSMAEDQIFRNREIKDRYEALLEQIGNSFRAKLMQFA